jgi:hypothetical protein
VIEGHQIFDFENMKNRIPAKTLTPEDQQFPKHGTPYLNHTMPDRIKFTDDLSCAMDALDMAIGPPSLLSRDALGLPFGSINLSHPNVFTALKTAGLVLEAIKVPGVKGQPSLEQVLKQKSGVYIVEFQWGDSSVAHTIAVNCNLRLVFCNTLGAVPFTLAGKTDSCLERETAMTHANITKRFGVRRITRVWQVLRLRLK